jgi:hypothetical protein
MRYPADGMRIGPPEGEPRETHRELCAAVQAVRKGQKLVSSGVERGQQRCAFIRLAAATAEKRPAYFPGQDPGELFGKIHNGFGQVYRSCMLQSPDLLTYRLHDLGMAVTQGVDAHAGV